MKDNEFKQTWWDNNLKNKFSEFAGWVGDYNAESKIFVRNYIRKRGFKTLVDCGCGPATEFFGYKNDGYDIQYLGVDSSEFLIDLLKKKEVPVIKCSIDKIDLEDSSYEVAFSRHVLEHQPEFTAGLSEFIRIAKKEVVNVFFIKPTTEYQKIDYDPRENLFHNRYNLNDIEWFLSNNSKVSSWEWMNVNSSECVLVVKLKELP